MRLPTYEDFMLFSAWDGYLVAVWCLVLSGSARALCRIWKLEWDVPAARKLWWSANAARAVAVVSGGAAYLWCPDRGPGAWGVAAILGIAIAIINGAALIRGKKPLV